MTKENKTDNLILLLMALGAVIFHITLNGQYGFHRDELDFIMNARQLDWGYISYPPITPFFARIGLELFGESLRGLRVLPAIAQGIVMILAGLMARDMGGKRNAQILTAFMVFIAPVSMFGGTVIMYFAFDYLWWVLVAFFTVRLLVTDDARYWLGIGAGIGLGMMTKYTMAFFVAGLVIAVLITSARKYLLSKWLYLGAGAGIRSSSSPISSGKCNMTLLPSTISPPFMHGIFHGDVRMTFCPSNFFSRPILSPCRIWTVGLSLCLFSVSMKRFRVLGWMFIVTFVLFLINKGRGYYTGPAYVMLLAAGCVWFESWLGTRTETKRRVGFGLLWTTQVIGSLIAIVLMKPIGAVNSALWDFRSDVSGDLFVEMVGWQELTAQVAEIYQSIPESEKPRTVILAGNYGEAGAFDLYGDEYGLPRMITGANSMWYRGYGEPEPETVIVVGFEGDYARAFLQVVPIQRHGDKCL